MVTRSNTISKAGSRSTEPSSTPKTFGRIDLLDENGELKQTWLLDSQSCMIGSDTKARVQIADLQPTHLSVIFGRRNTHIKCFTGTFAVGEKYVRESLVDEPTTIQVEHLTLVIFPTNFVPQTPAPEEQIQNFFESQSSGTAQANQVPSSRPSVEASAENSIEQAQNGITASNASLVQITEELRETLVSSTVVALSKSLEPFQVSLASLASQYGGLLQRQAQPKRDALHEEIERRFLQIEQQLPALSSEVEQLNVRLVESFEQTNCSMSQMADDIRSQFGSISNRFDQASSTRESSLEQSLALLANQLGSIQEQLSSISSPHKYLSHGIADEDVSLSAVGYVTEDVTQDNSYSSQLAEVDADEYQDIEDGVDDSQSDYATDPNNYFDAAEEEHPDQREFPLDDRLQGYIQSDQNEFDQSIADSNGYEDYRGDSSSQPLEEPSYQSDDGYNSLRTPESDDAQQEDAEWETAEESHYPQGEEVAYDRYSDADDSIDDSYEVSSDAQLESEADYIPGKSVKTPTASYTPISRKDIESDYSNDSDDRYSSPDEYTTEEKSAARSSLPSWFTRDDIEAENSELDDLATRYEEHAREASPSNKFDSAVYHPTLESSDPIAEEVDEEVAWNPPAHEVKAPTPRSSQLLRSDVVQAEDEGDEATEAHQENPTPRKSQPFPRKSVPLTESRRAAATADFNKESISDFAPEIDSQQDEGGEELVDDEESVEEYMQRLLARVKGSDTVAAPAPATQSRSALQSVNTVRTKPLAKKTVPPKVSESFEHRTLSSEEYIPRTAVPENSLNLEAMRSLANETARSAIAKSLSVKPAPKHANYSKLGVSVFGFIIGTALLLVNGITLNASFLGMICGYLIFLIWGYEATQNVSLTSKSK